MNELKYKVLSDLEMVDCDVQFLSKGDIILLYQDLEFKIKSCKDLEDFLLYVSIGNKLCC